LGGDWIISKANVYGEGYQVLHLGYGVKFENQFAYMAEQENIPVYRIGKTADVIQASGYGNPIAKTRNVLQIYSDLYKNSEENAVFLVNVKVQFSRQIIEKLG
jgi:phosphopentomutase